MTHFVTLVNMSDHCNVVTVTTIPVISPHRLFTWPARLKLERIVYTFDLQRS